MIFRFVSLAAMAASAAATSFIPGDMPANSRAGSSLLSKATVEHRGLEGGDEGDTTWISGYSIKYTGCASLIQVAGGEGGGGGGEDGSLLYTQHLVKFSLCPTGSCSSCSGGAQYVVNMNDFVDAYTEMKLDAQEYACEMVRENCYCDNANDDDVCEASCYTAAGLDDCIEYDGDEEFEIQEYLECSEMEGGNDNNNNNNNGNYNNQYSNGDVNPYQTYYMSAYCDNGSDIYIGVFLDAGCSTQASNGDAVYASKMYGAKLPYGKSSGASIVTGECISCMYVDNDNDDNNNNNNNNNYNYELIELCEESYENAAKCESNLAVSNKYFYPDEMGCSYINNVLPKLEKATYSINKASSVGGDGTASTTFAVLFGLSTVVLGAYSFFLYRKIHRAKVNLSQAEGGAMA